MTPCGSPGSTGSSPHTRGARPAQDHLAGHGRIIPAYAGSTRICAAGEPPVRDHPRIRGEHRHRPTPSCHTRGSSPHTRGAHSPAVCRRSNWRIIPAYAGSTATRRIAGSEWEDHPRIRGEHVRGVCSALSHCGSSPHTRGAQMRVKAEDYESGIIPAYAGSTLAEARSDRRQGGSSPHTRGAPDESVYLAQRPRIIPAYAGSTIARSSVHWASADHPRIRGEHASTHSSDCGSRGSSPHTRGALLARLMSMVRSRIIPAYAGSTKRAAL